MKKSNILPTVVLSAICVTVALLLAVVNSVTAPIIEAARAAQANEALLVVFPDGEDFEEMDITDAGLPASVVKAYKETSGKGFVFQVSSTGYKPGLIVMCGVDNEGKVTGTKCLESNETNGVEGSLDGKFNTMTLDTLTVDVIASSTKTCEGYRDAVKAALQAQIICSGGSVDIRDPEQILQDNCNAALGTEGLTFKKWFAVEEIAGVDALYLPENAEGAVAKVGDLFVGVNASGEVVTPGEEFAEITEVVKNAYAIYSASVLTEITLPEGVSQRVVGAWKTASGNYVFEIEAAGYGINGEYVASGEYVRLKVALTAEGVIISTLTTYQNETAGIGDVCMTPEYYEQFNGTTIDSYNSVENVTGATVTTSGYKRAVKTAFDTLALVKEAE